MKIHEIKSYIINLRNKPDRYQKSLENLRPLSIRPERFEAVNASELPSEYLQKITYPSVGYHIRTGRLLDNHFCSYGAVGCFLSHVQLWKQLVDSPDEMYLILEDDIEIRTTDEEINRYLSSIKGLMWDVAYLGYIKPKFIHTIDVQVKQNVYRIADMTLTTHAYLIHKRGAEKLLAYAFPIVDQLDSYMSYMMEKGVSLYRPNHSLIVQSMWQISELQTFSTRSFINRFSNLTWIISLAIIIIGSIWISRKLSKK